MTTYHLSLTRNDGPTGSSVSRILASLTSEEPSTVAATLRAAADQLDPPRPVYRIGAKYADAMLGTTATRNVRRPVPPRDAMVCPDCTDDAHTYQPGKCALKPPWNGVVVRHPGDRMDVPDAVLTPAAAEVVARVDADLEIVNGPLVGARVRRLGNRITPDGCGPVHTHTGSCAYASKPVSD